MTAFRNGQKDGHVNINIFAANSTYFAAHVDLLQSYVNPTWNIEFYKLSSVLGSTLLSNISIRVCEMLRFSSRNLFVNAFMEVVREFTNFTLTCPLRANRFFVHLDTNNMKRLFPIRLFYEPNTFIQVRNEFYEQAPKGNFTLLAEFVLNCVIKRYYLY